ncbi:MAG: flagellar hook protein FlgE [Myxococcaceae bacterium]
MSLLTALTTGTAGLQANSTELSIVGDNIANANTIGFKAGRAAFQDQLMQELMGVEGGGQVGLGARLQAVQRIITQGALTTTGLATDLALDGAGFFVLKGVHAGIQGQFFTRAGQFTVDKDGFLTSLDGLRVQGYSNDAAGNPLGTLGDLQVGNATAVAKPTANITIKANLDSDAALKVYDPLNPVASSNAQSSVVAYDSLGKAYAVDIFYTHTATGTWEWHATTDGANIAGGTAGTPSEIASGTLNFDTDGKLLSEAQSSNFTPLNATAPQPLTFNVGDPLSAATPGTGLVGITQFQAASATTFTGQDGAPYGALTNVQINNKGEVVGAFTNGTVRTLGQVAVADFQAADRLTRSGGNLLQESLESGQATIGAPAEGGRASVKAGALEQSNVDLAGEFVRMIAAQRGFQANSKTITTADQLLQELMQLKR